MSTMTLGLSGISIYTVPTTQHNWDLVTSSTLGMRIGFPETTSFRVSQKVTAGLAHQQHPSIASPLVLEQIFVRNEVLQNIYSNTVDYKIFDLKRLGMDCPRGWEWECLSHVWVGSSGPYCAWCECNISIRSRELTVNGLWACRTRRGDVTVRLRAVKHTVSSGLWNHRRDD